ncbi:QsdR family transcriptional regulator [Amycolatopsis sp. lyj-346]|uniref:QsdR family transcriptional regulator n=1 Tax=Amycolatopsis sp. lyj-346 TaxID=2789289 RepID=UPI0039794E3B
MASPKHSRRVVSRDQVVRGACRFFLTHGMIDMDRLAVHLAISRATLYRVAHSRDGLLGEVLWRLAQRQLARARQRREQGGADGVLEVTWSFVDRLHAAVPFRAFLRGEPDTAARVLFTTSGLVHRRVVSVQREILRETHRGLPWPPSLLDQTAYLYVRIIESALYAELFGAAPPDPEVVERAARAVLPQHG